MKKNLVERRMVDSTVARPNEGEHCAHRPCREAQTRSFVVNDRETGVRSDEPDTQKQQRHHLARDLIRLTGADWHIQSWLGRTGKPAQALSNPRYSRTMSRASCVWRH